MKKITRESVIKIAKISNIEILDHEIDQFVNDLQAVFNYASSLEDAVKKYSKPTEAIIYKPVNVTRPDAQQPYPTQKLMEQAPKQEENYFIVPLIIKQTGSL